MKTKPTYKAEEIRDMCIDFELDFGTFKILIDLIDQELALYDEDSIIVLMQASMIVFTRSLLKLSLENMKGNV